MLHVAQDLGKKWFSHQLGGFFKCVSPLSKQKLEQDYVGGSECSMK